MKNSYEILVFADRDEKSIKARIDWGLGDNAQRVYVGPCNSERAVLIDCAAAIAKAEGRESPALGTIVRLTDSVMDGWTGLRCEVIAPEPNPLIKGWVRLKLCSGVRPDGHTVPFYWNPDSLEEDSHEVALGKR